MQGTWRGVVHGAGGGEGGEVVGGDEGGGGGAEGRGHAPSLNILRII